MRTIHRLFHGTNAAHVNALRETGFRFERGPSLAFGDGVYFYADRASAERFAREKFGDDGSVVAVDVAVLPGHLKKMAFHELDAWPAAINQRAASEGWHVIDASCDDGIFVVRPVALKNIVIIDAWPARERDGGHT